MILSGANAFIDYAIRPEFKTGESVKAVVTTDCELSEGTEILGRGFFRDNMSCWQVSTVIKSDDASVSGFKRYEVVITYKFVNVENVDTAKLKKLDSALGKSLAKIKNQMA